MADVYLDPSDPYIELRPENNKNDERHIRQIDSETCEILRAMRPEDWQPEMPVLPYKIPNSTRLAKDLEKLGIPYRTDLGQIDFHAFRHTTATLFYQAGAHTSFVQMLLGHKKGPASPEGLGMALTSSPSGYAARCMFAAFRLLGVAVRSLKGEA